MRNLLVSLLIIAAPTTIAVDITFHFPPSPYPSQPTRGPQTCTNVLPGRCCVPVPSYPPHDGIPSAGDAFGYQVSIANLDIFDIAFVWAEHFSNDWRSTVGFPGFRVDMPGCKTRVWESRLGPGDFVIGDAPNQWATTGFHYPIGASFIKLPQGLPTEKDKGMSEWLNMEGITRLILGGGMWSGDGVRYPFNKRRIGGGLMRRMFGKREDDGYRNRARIVRAEATGLVEWRSPGFLKYPDVVEVNGVNFTDGWRGDLVYRDEAGRVLNLTNFTAI
ncbi:MAG: hypothetical protein Q9201_004954 [Fulgogasparrea decipioides]